MRNILNSKMSLVFVLILISVLFSCQKASDESSGFGETESVLSPVEELGKRLFFDPNLSDPPGQSCAFCHGPEVGFSGPLEEVNGSGAVYEGAVKGRFGNRKPPVSAYAGESPVLKRDEENNFVGGMFWDGRASGDKLGDPLAEQAMGPFLNPLEMNNADEKSVVEKVMESDYADFFEKIWGQGSLDSENDVQSTYEKIVRSIAAYERSDEVNPFNSKFDDFWRNAGKSGMNVETIDETNWQDFSGLGLDESELKGMMLFVNKGKCADCHPLTSIHGKPPLFTDFTYDNLGVPRNPANPFYSMAAEWNPDGQEWLDGGLGAYLAGTDEYAEYAEENYGKQKVPTLRNVALSPVEGFVKAFMHNGFFTSLKEIVHFYNTRDVDGEDWPPAEVTENVNTEELGNLGMTPEEEDAIVLFMKTLSDRR